MGAVRHDAGGIRSLRAVLTDRWGAVEADFQRYYQLDLRREIRGSARRLWQLVSHLPQESATWRSKGWTQQEELTAMQIEVTHAGLLALAELKTKGKARLPREPLELQRPGEERKPSKVMSITEFAQLVGGGEDIDG